MCNIIQDLIDEGVLVLYQDYRYRCALDQSGNDNHGVLTDVAWTGRGAAFPSFSSKITVPDSPELRLVQGSIIVLADNYIQNGVGVYVAKRDGGGVNYQYQRTASQLQLYDGTYVRTIAEDMAGKRYSAINFNGSEIPVGHADLGTPVNYSGVAAVSTDDAPIEIGNYSSGNQFRGVMQAVLIVNRKLTATEHSQLYGQLSAMGAPTKVVSHLKDFDPNELVDGDMEAVGTAAWSAGGGASLSKDETGARHGLRWLKVSKATTGFGYAHQTPFTVGKRYLVRGYARGDGVIAPVIYGSGAALIWAGVASTTWQYFEIEHTAVFVRLDLASLFASAGYVGFDDIQVTEIGKGYPPVLTHSDWGANESDSAVTSGFIENTPFEALTGSFKVITDTLGGEEIKAFECISTGTIQFPFWGDGSDSGWTGYEDTGAGYTLTTLSLTALVYSMTTGDKLAISDRAGNLSVRKE